MIRKLSLPPLSPRVSVTKSVGEGSSPHPVPPMLERAPPLTPRQSSATSKPSMHLVTTSITVSIPPPPGEPSPRQPTALPSVLANRSPRLPSDGEASIPRGDRRYKRTVRRFVRRASPALRRGKAGSSEDAHRTQDLLAEATVGGKVYRSFDPKEGRVVYHRGEGLPNLERLVQQYYVKLWKDTQEVENAEFRVANMKEQEQVQFAAASLKRKAQGKLDRALKRGVLEEKTALVRMQQALLTEYAEVVSHLGFDTEELSLIRVHNAATDEVIHQKASYLARLEVERLAANEISDDLTRVDILGMQLDHFRHKHVPFVMCHTKRNQQPNSALGLPEEEGAGRRRSTDRSVSQRAGVHSIVEKLQHAMAFRE